MKLMTLRFLLSAILAGLLLVPAAGTAQTCQPDTSFTLGGIYPDSLPPACVGIPYQSNITLVVPVDTTVAFPPFGTFTLPIDSIVLDDILGLPTGMTYGCNPGSCSLPGGTTGCVGITGTASTADTIDLRVAITLYVLTPFGPLTQPDTIDGLFLLYVNPGFSTTTVGTNATCGASDGTAKVMASGGSGSFTYSWNTGATTDSIGGLGAGLYTVVTTDSTGCVKTDTVIITTNGANPVLAVDTAYWDGCSSTGGGIVTVSASGGDGTYTYSWSNGATSDSVGGLVSGTYTITVQDGLGCSDFEIVDVVQPSELTVSTVSTTNISCFGDNTGEIVTTVTGGIGAYTIAWSTLPNETGTTVSNLPAGAYDIMVMDEAGCSKAVNFSLTEPDSLEATFTFTGETAFNQMDGTAVATISGGVAPYTYAWDTGATTDSIGGLAPGIYTLSVSDANACVLIDSVEIPGAAQSVRDQLGIQAFSVAPNPSSGFVTVSWDLGNNEKANLRLRDLNGRLMQEWKGISRSGSLQDYLDIPEGIYLIEISTETGIGYKKLILQK